jgi:hypothetical protein
VLGLGLVTISSFQTFLKKLEKIRRLKRAQEGPGGPKMKSKSRGEKQEVIEPRA